MIEIRWQGRGGQGAFTASRLLGLSASLYEGKSALAFPSFGPERRGAPMQAFTKIDDTKITDRSDIKFCNYIVILDETIAGQHLVEDLQPNGLILINSASPEKYLSWKAGSIVTIDATSLALEILKKPITNTAMLGALLGATELISLDSVVKGIAKEMPAALVDRNVEIVRRAYAAVKEGV